jgi:hypothetical protein
MYLTNWPLPSHHDANLVLVINLDDADFLTVLVFPVLQRRGKVCLRGASGSEICSF